MTKTCKRCGITYPATKEYFHIHAVKNYRGLHPYCKICRHKERVEYNLKHKEIK